MPAPTDINPGTGKAYAVNPSSGVYDDNYFAKTFSGGSSGGSSGGAPSIDYAGQRQMALDAVQPAVSSLQASLPEISTKFQTQQTQLAAEKQPLKDRYDQLLSEIRGRETSQINSTTQTANREFARRGITADSTFAAEETAGRTAPIRSAAQSDILSTTFDRESKLREIDNSITNLTQDMIESQRNIRNTIAQIQATAGTDAANRALEMYKVQQQEKENALNRAITEKSALKTQVVTQSGNQLLIDSLTGDTIRNIGPEKATSTGNNTALSYLKAKANGGSTTYTPPSFQLDNTSGSSAKLK